MWLVVNILFQLLLNHSAGQPQSFPLNVRPARNFPVDLYLLMDLSFSMNDDLANLKRLGAQLGKKIVYVLARHMMFVLELRGTKFWDCNYNNI